MSACDTLPATVHGTAVVVAGAGVLILGEAGIGKSALALDLVGRGHRLIADDLVELHPFGDINVQASGARLGLGWLVLRGLGPVSAARLYGAQSCIDRHTVDLVVILHKDAPSAHLGSWGIHRFGPATVPTLDLDAANPRLALYTELAVAVMDRGPDRPAHRRLFEDRLHEALEPPTCE